MGDRIIGPGRLETGYHSKLKKPPSNRRQQKCPFKIRDCKVCYHKLIAKVGDLPEDKYVLKAPDWVRNEFNIHMVLANFYPGAATNQLEQKRAIRDVELIDVCWRRHMPAANSPLFDMTGPATRKRLSRIKKDAENYIMRKKEDPSWFVVSLPDADAGGPYTQDELDDYLEALQNNTIDAYIKKWCLPFYFHTPRCK